MAILIFETTDPDFWPCPEGCGGATEDAGGGPCQRCWDAVPNPYERLDDQIGDRDAE